MNDQMQKWCNATSWLGTVAATLALVGILLQAGQQLPPGRFTDFSLPEYYGAPHEAQMKQLLQGAEAYLQAGNRILLKGTKMQTYRPDGSGEFVMEADDCVYDGTMRTVESEGPLEIRTADGRFLTSGRGFLWQPSLSVLTISNSVHTVIRLQKAPSAKP